ncbi:MAG: hypothetical protein IJX16_07515 [Clostridia bacterium]|nr:hypothetical protein [Clostridia bacterium]MBQ8427586.1 hypothetical protein [Clostridia bacterium]
MIIRIKKYVAKVARFVENEDTGVVTKEVSKITLNGQRFSEASVWKRIPRDAQLISHGYVEEAFEVDTDALRKFCMENGKPVIKDNANNANTN